MTFVMSSDTLYIEGVWFTWSVFDTKSIDIMLVFYFLVDNIELDQKHEIGMMLQEGNED